MVGVCSYLLVSFWFTRIAANQSSMSAFLTNRVGDCLFTIGMFVILWSFGNNQEIVKESNVRKKYNSSSARLRLLKYNGILLPVSLASAPFVAGARKVKIQLRHYSSNVQSKIGPYLAGLIEGDGHIAVQDEKSNSRVHRPKIIIAFNIKDKPLAEKLCTLLKVGKVIDKSKAGHVLLQILAKEEVLKIINLINGHMRTPKIEGLHRAINWINLEYGTYIPCLGLDISPLNSNSWLTGFTDADGNFSISIYNRKNKNTVKTNIQTFFRIEVKQNYNREVTVDQGGTSYFNIMTKIAEFFTVNLYTRTRTVDEKRFYAFMAIAHNSRSHKIVRDYFDRFPLCSSKYLAYKDWCRVQDIHSIGRGTSLNEETLNEIKRIKDQFNNKRKVFDFSHLNDLII